MSIMVNYILNNFVTRYQKHSLALRKLVQTQITPHSPPKNKMLKQIIEHCSEKKLYKSSTLKKGKQFSIIEETGVTIYYNVGKVTSCYVPFVSRLLCKIRSDRTIFNILIFYTGLIKKIITIILYSRHRTGEGNDTVGFMKYNLYKHLYY